MVHVWTRHRVLFHVWDLRTRSQSSLVLICPNSKGLCVAEVADGEALLAEGETCFPEQPGTWAHHSLFLRSFPHLGTRISKLFTRPLADRVCFTPFVLPLCSRHLRSPLYWVIEPQPLSVRDLQSTLSRQAGRPAPLRTQAPPLSSAFSVPGPTQLMGRPFCDERRWVNTASALGDWLGLNRGCVQAFRAPRPTGFNHCSNWFGTLKPDCLLKACVDSIPASKAGGLPATQSLFWLSSPQ